MFPIAIGLSENVLGVCDDMLDIFAVDRSDKFDDVRGEVAVWRNAEVDGKFVILRLSLCILSFGFS